MFKQTKWLAVIQGNHWVVAKVKKSKAELKILKIAEYTMEVDTSVEASLNLLSQPDVATLTSSLSLRQWLQKEKVPLKRLYIAFSCQGVITRMITLPILPVKDLNSMLTDQVDQYFTLNIADYLVDYRIVDHFEEDGQKRQHILLAALPRFQWNQLWDIFKETGIRPKAVDLSPDCLSRLYGLISIKTGKFDQKEQPLFIEDIAIIDLGRERIEFVLLEKGLFFLFSDLQLSLEGLRQMITGNQEESAQEAGLQTALYTEVENALMPILRMLEDFINFFSARHFGKTIDHIYITGEYADLPFLEQVFNNNFEIKTNIGFPGGWRASFGKRVNGSEDWMKYGSLYGLALRED